MKRKAWELAGAGVLLVVGSFYTFTPPKTLIAWGIGFLRHNDRVLFGILCLILAGVLAFKNLKKK